MSPLDFLLAVRTLLDQPDRWIPHGIARNEDGTKVSITHPRASKFSLDGAFYRIHYITKCPNAGTAYLILKRTIDPTEAVLISSFNGALNTTHHAVIKMLDRAIVVAGGTPPSAVQEER